MRELPFFHPDDRPSRWAVVLLAISTGLCLTLVVLLLLTLLWP